MKPACCLDGTWYLQPDPPASLGRLSMQLLEFAEAFESSNPLNQTPIHSSLQPQRQTQKIGGTIACIFLFCGRVFFMRHLYVCVSVFRNQKPYIVALVWKLYHHAFCHFASPARYLEHKSLKPKPETRNPQNLNLAPSTENPIKPKA